jgi:hypothetical protein
MGRGKPSITLEYQLVRKNRILPKQQSLSQLLDFESSLVLAKVADLDTRTVIDRFVSQFRWVRATADVCSNLGRAGHFAKQKYNLTWPLAHTSPKSIQQTCLRGKQMLKRWEDNVESSRASNPLMNGLSIAQLARVSSWLVKSSEERKDDDDDNDRNKQNVNGSSKEEEADEEEKGKETPGDPMVKLARLLRVTGHNVDMSVDDMKRTWKTILSKYTTSSGNFISIEDDDAMLDTMSTNND